MDIDRYVDELAEKALRDEPSIPLGQSDEPLVRVRKGRAIELWSTSAGRLFLVADESDARQAMERYGARCGEIYTTIEATRIVAVRDAAVVSEIQDWKRRFNGVVHELRYGNHPK
jgi:hypothetical protein